MALFDDNNQRESHYVTTTQPGRLQFNDNIKRQLVVLYLAYCTDFAATRAIVKGIANDRANNKIANTNMIMNPIKDQRAYF
jgi:ABC-type Fe3+-citrate transport system substrate-binding protein